VSTEGREVATVALTEETSVEPATAQTAVAAPLATPAPAAAAHGALKLRAGRAAALERLQAVAGQIVPQLQYQVTRIGLAGQAGLAALAAAAAVAIGALVPAYHAVQTLTADIARAQHPAATVSVQQAGRLVASLPTRAQMPAVLGQVFSAAQSAGVALDTGRYSYTPAKSGVIAHYDLEFPVKSVGYPNIRTFINGTLTAVPAASLEKLHVERKVVGDQAVSADVGFVVFVRAGESP
jgi:hypothetical protein